MGSSKLGIEGKRAWSQEFGQMELDPSLYTHVRERWSSIGRVFPAAALGPFTEASLCPSVANRWSSRRGVSTEGLSL